MPRRVLVFVLLLQLAAVLPAMAAKRVALVIGNAAYSQAPALTNPVNDAADMAKALTEYGFDVILGLDLDRASFNEKVRAFSRVLEEADAAILFMLAMACKWRGIIISFPWTPVSGASATSISKRSSSISC